MTIPDRLRRLDALTEVQETLERYLAELVSKDDGDPAGVAELRAAIEQLRSEIAEWRGELAAIVARRASIVSELDKAPPAEQCATCGRQPSARTVSDIEEAIALMHRADVLALGADGGEDPGDAVAEVSAYCTPCFRSKLHGMRALATVLGGER